MRGRNNNNGGNRKGPNPLSRSYESNGPDVKIRGNAHHVAEKYLQLARDAQSSGDPVGAESYLQHAEHYFRLIASYQQTQQMGYNRPADDADDGDDEDNGLPDRFASPQPPTPYVPQPAQPQPYMGDRPQPNYGGDRDRNQGGERQPYNERNNGYGQRQDRNGQNGQRRPYREDRFNAGRDGGEARQGDFRGNGNERRNGYDRMQERIQHQERFAGERGYRDASEQPRDPYAGEQPRIDDARPEVDQPPVLRSDAADRPEPVTARSEAPARTEPAERTVPDEAPGLPSFITTPTRPVAAERAEEPAAEPAASAFPGEPGAEAPKFPRRRRRTTRAAAAAASDEAPPAEQPAGE